MRYRSILNKKVTSSSSSYLLAKCNKLPRKLLKKVTITCNFVTCNEITYSTGSDTNTTDTLDSLEETDVSDDDDDVDWEINLEDDVDSSASDDENN